MLPKRARLTKADFQKKAITRVTFQFGTIERAPGVPKAAVVVSKKVSPRAVDRNLLRRRTYSILRTYFKEGKILSHMRIYLNKASLNASPHALEKSFKKILG